MNYEELIQAMTPEMHQSLKRAVELGKWPDGRKLTPEQRDICMRAVIAYDHDKVAEDQRVGFIDRTKPDGSQHGKDPLEPDTIKILTDDKN
ncbi:MAG: YeaC family protein [Neptuniibacter sp.]